MTEVADLLDATADLFETEGRARGIGRDDCGRYCLVAGLHNVGRRRDLPLRVVWSAIHRLEHRPEVDAPFGLTQFNDRTEDDTVVIALLRSTANEHRTAAQRGWPPGARS